MVRPNLSSLTSFEDVLPASGEYFLSDVRLDIADPTTFIVMAKLHGPIGAPVWTRAWVSNQTDGTLAESSSPQMTAGEHVVLTIKLNADATPEHAYIRIESAPLHTQHVVGVKLI